jgi:hypothetical protein
MVFKIKEVLEETEKGAKVVMDIPRVSVLTGAYEVRIQEVTTWIPKSKVDGDGIIDAEWMGWKMKPVLLQKNGQKGQEGPSQESTESA